MQLKKNRREGTKVDLSKYANVDTGELLSSELQDKITITARKDTGQFIINSDNYVVFDTGAMQYLMDNLNGADVSKVFIIGKMVIGDCSVICQNNNHPHTPDTLCVTLDMNMNKFYELVRRLTKKNILAYCVCAPSGYLQKIYMLNPYIARRRKTLNCELQTFFRDVTKDGQVLNSNEER